MEAARYKRIYSPPRPRLANPQKTIIAFESTIHKHTPFSLVIPTHPHHHDDRDATPLIVRYGRDRPTTARDRPHPPPSVGRDASRPHREHRQAAEARDSWWWGVCRGR